MITTNEPSQSGSGTCTKIVTLPSPGDSTNCLGQEIVEGISTETILGSQSMTLTV